MLKSMRRLWGQVCSVWKGGWWYRTVPALLYTPLQDLQMSPQPIAGIPQELITAVVLHWYRGRKRCWLRHLGVRGCDLLQDPAPAQSLIIHISGGAWAAAWVTWVLWSVWSRLLADARLWQCVQPRSTSSLLRGLNSLLSRQPRLGKSSSFSRVSAVTWKPKERARGLAAHQGEKIFRLEGRFPTMPEVASCLEIVYRNTRL